MRMRIGFGFAVALAVAAVPAVAQTSSDPSASQDPAKNPAAGAITHPPGEAATDMSPELIAKGDAVYHGPGNCYACHGAKAEGSVGPNLTDAEWIHSKGTYEDIVRQIGAGVPKEESKSGIPMPPKGGSTISDDDVKAVAAYVYSLRQK